MLEIGDLTKYEHLSLEKVRRFELCVQFRTEIGYNILRLLK